ncbi:DNA-binding MarR family transcriptional regulator [Sphingobium sp. B1D7B]|uniref:MarR family winged helix-turn-helix transcriptional regulator n=1 Tax=Sphingobium sp. B1D7B TaxID=2940578 RepID=UPI0022254FB8|nr:MarR family transcriptional regulator [Sphingobium sp. B1D7B]MCW2406854.1 DNA-binding MarR family transcriptional regulator [Sphingobium sp. B1D7B]
MQTEHGGFFGFRMIVAGNFFSNEPHAQIFSEFGLLEDDLNVLANLRDWGGMTAQVICTLTGRPKNSIHRAVVRLTERGAIISTIDTGDRRRAILTITDSGRELFAKATKPFWEQEKKMFGCLSKRETEQLDKLLLKILKNWSNEFIEE